MSFRSSPAQVRALESTVEDESPPDPEDKAVKQLPFQLKMSHDVAIRELWGLPSTPETHSP